MLRLNSITPAYKSDRNFCTFVPEDYIKMVRTEMPTNNKIDKLFFSCSVTATESYSLRPYEL